MRKILRWYLALLLLAAVCILGAWVVSSRGKEPANATLVWNTPDSRGQNIQAHGNGALRNPWDGTSERMSGYRM